jgi:UDP-N-acetyl-D-glucosamine/UDP-N-acetyl-D-galactosamine dehydrogenase
MSVVAVIGLGYVGLPLVVEFAKHVKTIGFDIAQNKVDSCLRGVDPSRELSDEEMKAASTPSIPPMAPVWPKRTSSSWPCPRR